MKQIANNYLLCEDYVEDNFIDSKTETLNKSEMITLAYSQVKVLPSASALVEDLSEIIKSTDSVHYEIIKNFHHLALSEQRLHGFPAIGANDFGRRIFS